MLRKQEHHYQLTRAKKIEAQKQAWADLSMVGISPLVLRVETKAQLLTIALLISVVAAQKTPGKKSDEPTCTDKNTCRTPPRLVQQTRNPRPLLINRQRMSLSLKPDHQQIKSLKAYPNAQHILRLMRSLLN